MFHFSIVIMPSSINKSVIQKTSRVIPQTASNDLQFNSLQPNTVKPSSNNQPGRKI